jgi:hypothetical protein
MGWVRVMNGVDAVGGESEGRVVSKVIRVGAACLGCELNQRFVYCLLLCCISGCLVHVHLRQRVLPVYNGRAQFTSSAVQRN